MILEHLDKTISIAIALGSAFVGWQAHLTQMEKERKRIQLEERDRYAAQKVQETHEHRDFAHLKRNLEQLSASVAQLNAETDKRLDRLENQLKQMMGAMNILKAALPKK